MSLLRSVLGTLAGIRMSKVTIERSDLESLINLVLYTKLYDIQIIGDKIFVVHGGGSQYGHLPIHTEFTFEEQP